MASWDIVDFVVDENGRKKAVIMEYAAYIDLLDFLGGISGNVQRKPRFGQRTRCTEPASTVEVSSASSPQLGPNPRVVERIYQLVGMLPRYNGHSKSLPKNGVYVFFEKGETIQVGNKTMDRIVNVGTHRKPDRLPQRILKEHYQTSSALRGHVCRALLNKEDPADSRLRLPYPHRVPVLRDRVSKIMQERFTFTCFRVDDHEERRVLESGLIAALARSQPSAGWLGRFSTNGKVLDSGLWNDQHVNGSPLEPEGLGLLESRILAELSDRETC